MMKHWFRDHAESLVCALALAIILCALCAHAHAQFIGYVSQQTFTSTPVNAQTCTAALASGDITVANVSQGAHFLTLLNSTAQSLVYALQGSYDGTTYFDISDQATGSVNTFGRTGATGTGYYPVVAVKVLTCTPGTATLTLQYSGISLTPGQPAGTNLNGALVKNLALAVPANTGFMTPVMRSPFGSSGGVMQLVFAGGAGPAGSSLQLQCGTNDPYLLNFGPAIPLQTSNAAPQSFLIPPGVCTWFQVAYTSGGASAAVFDLDYAFNLPGVVAPNPFQYTHVTGTTATAAKTTGGMLHSLTVNTGGAGTISLFDLPSASCTGTPSTNTVAVITATATTLQSFTYDLIFFSGICVKASAAMDFTISSR